MSLAILEDRLRSQLLIRLRNNKNKYRKSEKGKAQRQRESAVRYAKIKAAKAKMQVLLLEQEPAVLDTRCQHLNN